MTAPAAPIIKVRTNGTTVRVRWQPVDTATDYKLYAGPAPAPSTLEADIPDSDVGTDGWFQYTFVALDADAYVALTALNLLAEESAQSNEAHLALTGDGRRIPTAQASPFA